MSNALVVYESPEAVRKDFASLEPAVRDVLPGGADAGRFVRVVTKAVIENPKLMECTRASLWASIHEAAQLGLEPTGLLGSAYLVPYMRKVTVEIQGRMVERKVMEAQLIPGYRGLIDLARRSGQIEAIEAEVVRRRDTFDYERTRQPNPIVHRPFIPDPADPPEERDRGPIVGAYMIATLRGGYRQPEWMTYDEIEQVRKRSKAADKGPWVTDYSEMARKTVVRRGSKYLPLTTELRRALELDEEAERYALPPVPAAPLRATAMLLDRARAARTAQDDSLPGEAVEEPNETAGTPSEPPDEAARATVRGLAGLAAPDADQPLASQVAQASDSATIQPEEYVEPEERWARPIAGLADPTAVIDTNAPLAEAKAICGQPSPEGGVCTRMPDHTAGHANETERWPRGK